MDAQRQAHSDGSVLARHGGPRGAVQGSLEGLERCVPPRPPRYRPLVFLDSPSTFSFCIDAHLSSSSAGNVKAELDVFVSTAGLRLVKPDGKVLGSFPLQRIQEWSITAPGTFSLSVVNGEKVVGLVIHGDPDEVFAIIDCLERQVAQIMEDMQAKEEGREAADVSSPPRKMPPEPEDEPRDVPELDPVPEESHPPAPTNAFEADMEAEETSDGSMPEELPDDDLPQSMSPSEFSDEVLPFRQQDSFVAEDDAKDIMRRRHRELRFRDEDTKGNGVDAVQTVEETKDVNSLKSTGEVVYDDDFDVASVSDDDEFAIDVAEQNTPSPGASPPNEPTTNVPSLVRRSSGEPNLERASFGGSLKSPPSFPRPLPKRDSGHSPESRMAATMAAAAARELGELKQKLRDAEEEIEAEKQRAEATGRVNDVAGVEEALERELAAVAERATTFERAVADAERRTSTAEKALAQANERAAAAESNFAELSDAVVERDADIARLRAAESEREVIAKGDTAAAEALAARVEQARADASAAVRRAGEAEARTVDAERRTDEAEASTVDAERRADEAESNATDLATKVVDLETKLSAAEASATQAKAELIMLRAAEVATLNARVVEANELEEKLKAKLAEVNARLEEETRGRESAESALQAATQRAELAENKASEFETALEIETEKTKSAEAFVPGKTSAVEIAALVDELRGKTAVAQAERAIAASEAVAATQRAEDAERRAEAAENLASQVELAAAKALERADTAEAETKKRDETLNAVLASQKDVADGDIAAVARAEAQRATAAETRSRTLEKRLDAAASARAEVAAKLAAAQAELAEARGEAEASREALDNAFASARAAAAREGDARRAQAEAEARIAETSDATATWSERASAADDLRVRAVAAEKRLEAAAKEGARAVSNVREETSRWRAEATELRAALEDAERRAESSARRAARVDAARNASSASASETDLRFDSVADANDQGQTPAVSVSFAKPSLSDRALEFSAYERPPPMPPSPETRAGAGAGYAATYHAASPSVEKRSPTPTKLTAEFLDSLGERLSSVRDLLTSPG